MKIWTRSVGRWIGVLVAGCFCDAKALEAQPAVLQPEVDAYTLLLWHFDEAPPSKSKTGAYHALGVTNLEFTEGRFGKALDGRALRDTITVFFSDKVGMFTVDFWAYFNAPPEKESTIITHVGEFVVKPGEQDGVNVQWKVRLGNGKPGLLSSPELPVKQWVHVRGTYEPRGIKLFIDGQEAGHLKDPDLMKQYAHILNIRHQLRVLPFDGRIDELHVSLTVRESGPSDAVVLQPATKLDPVATEVAPLARTTQIVPCDATAPADEELLLLPLNERHSYIYHNTLPKAVLTGETRLKLCFDQDTLHVSLRGKKLRGASPRPAPELERYEILFGASDTGRLRTITVLEDGRIESDEPAFTEGVVVRVRADADAFDADLTLPSSHFGLRELREGATLRFNVQRHQAYGETSAWSLVEKDSRAGVVTLAKEVGVRRSVEGRVVDQAGNAVGGAVVRSAWDMTWSDLSGHFSLNGILGDTVELRVDSEYHQSARYHFALEQDRERLSPMAVSEKKPKVQRSHFVTEPGPEYQDFNLYFHGIPSIERLPSGRLFVCYYGGDADEGGLNHCALVRSDDDGQTWSRPLFVVDSPGSIRAYDPVVWLDPRGRLWMFWAGQSISAVYTDNPDAETLTWSEPVEIGGRVALNKPIVLDDGTWLLPVDQAPHECSAYVSTDEGLTWTLRGTAEVPAGGWAQEPMAVQRKDGSLMMMIRTSNGIDESYSSDRGKTWTVSKASEVQSMIARFHISRMPSGRLLLVCHDQPNLGWGKSRRKNMTAFLSDDDGKTWPHKLLIDGRDEVTYPDATVTDDGGIYIVYDFRRSLGMGELFMADIHEEDILAGAITNTKSRLRVSVSKGSGVKK